MKACAVPLTANTLLLFAGDNGGASSRGGSYDWGSYHHDCWILRVHDAQTGGLEGTWEEYVDTVSITPSARSLHTMVSSPADATETGPALLVLFGGLQPTRDRKLAVLDGGSTASGTTDTAELWLGMAFPQVDEVKLRWQPVCQHWTSPWKDLTAPIGIQGDNTVVRACPDAQAGADHMATPSWPPPRHGHASAMQIVGRSQRAMWVFGGSALDCDEAVKPVSGAVTDVQRHSRHSCALSDLWVVTVHVSAGSSPPCKSVSSVLQAGGWTVCVQGGWRRPTPAGVSPELRGSAGNLWPLPRSHAGMVWQEQAEDASGLLVAAGANCARGCACLGDVWRAVTRLGAREDQEELIVEWTLVIGVATGKDLARDVTEAQRSACAQDRCPPPRYRHSLVSDSLGQQAQALARTSNTSAGWDAAPPSSGVWLFGGEAYHPSVYFADTWQLDARAVMQASHRSSLAISVRVVLVFLVLIGAGAVTGVACVASRPSKPPPRSSTSRGKRPIHTSASVIPWKRRAKPLQD